MQGSDGQSFQALLSEYMAQMQKKKALSMGVASGIVSAVTAPMITMAMSLQLSTNLSIL